MSSNGECDVGLCVSTSHFFRAFVLSKTSMDRLDVIRSFFLDRKEVSYEEARAAVHLLHCTGSALIRESVNIGQEIERRYGKE